MRKLALFRRVFLASRWLRERLTPAGMVLAGLIVFAAAFGLDTQANIAHALVLLGLSLLAMDALTANLARRLSACRASWSRLTARICCWRRRS